MKDLFVESAREFIRALVTAGLLGAEDEQAAFVMVAAFDFGPRAGLIARHFALPLSEVGDVVDRLDGAGFYADLRGGVHAHIWPEGFTAERRDGAAMDYAAAFVLDVNVAAGKLKRTYRDGEFYYSRG